MLFTVILKDNKGFQRCYRSGRYSVCGFVCAYFYPNGSPYNRLGITAGKKLGGAVERNRIKRIIRAAYRLNEEIMPVGYDIVFVGRNDIKDKSSEDIEGFIRNRLVGAIEKAVNEGAFDKALKKKNRSGGGRK